MGILYEIRKMERGINMQAKDIMVRNVITVKRDQTVEDVIRLLMEHNVSGLPVVDDDNRVVGIVSEGDLIYRSKQLKLPSYFTILDGYIFLESPKTMEEQIKKMVGYRVEDIMTEKVITLEEEDSIEKAASLMTDRKVNRLPVVKDGKLVGIISRRDIIRSYANI
jgi:CBS domain-containing protein